MALAARSAAGADRNAAVQPAAAKFFALPLADAAASSSKPAVLYKCGVPFVESALPLVQGGSAQVQVGIRAQRIFFLGMTDAKVSAVLPANAAHSHPVGWGSRLTPVYGWNDPRDYSTRFFIGDELGRIRLNYADGTTQIFPLRFGENIWFGLAFYEYHEPFPADAHLRQRFAAALRLYPPAPVEDGSYIAVIVPKAVPLQSIAIENSRAKKGTVVVTGITVESAGDAAIPGAAAFTASAFPPDFQQFVRTKAMLPLGEGERQSQQRLDDLRHALYTTDEQFKGHVVPSLPSGYSGPEVSFQGSVFAEILANVFRYNLQDIAAKVDASGMYHTSTKDAISWGGYRAFGTFRYGEGGYYGASFSRDMGRSLQELAALGGIAAAARNADYNFSMARRYETDSALEFKGVRLPPHWAQLVNKPRNSEFENDGQGLTIVSIYKLWQRLPDRDQWLRAHWPDIKAAGDWILWQFDHPEVSGSRDGLLRTTGESANGDGYSVYPDAVCMHALRDLATMADAMEDAESARQWRSRADRMQEAITAHYIVTDPKYGSVWTLDDSNWTHKSTVLGPLIFQADDEGFAPENSNPRWRAVNEATYQRLIDTYAPFGFYGQSMGYGQGFVTQSALLLDRMHDASLMLDWAAKQIYDPRYQSFIVPEGVQIDPSGRFWFRMGDLGNGVQEGEIVKTLRLVIGVDDTHPGRLQLFPRMPYGWNRLAVEKYPLVFASSGRLQTAYLRYQLRRSGAGMDLDVACDQAIGPVRVRLGPFAKRPQGSSVRVNGRTAAGAVVEHSGDSWWLRFTMPPGQIARLDR